MFRGSSKHQILLLKLLFIYTYLSVVRTALRSLSMVTRDTLRTISLDISKAIGREVNIHYPPLLGYSEGGGASTGIITCDNTGEEFFLKSGSFASYSMLHAEYIGISDIYQTKTIRVPRPICCGVYDQSSYVVFEKLRIGGRFDDCLFAKKLADMHRNLSPNGMFGYHINNTIGATFQPNTYTANWAEFWDKYRFGHILSLAKRDGGVFPYEKEVRQKVYDILSKHDCVPSLVHGDLWSGNQGYLPDGEPVIFDPAVYYGDREVDIAMTKLFGSNSRKFYETYDESWPLPEGHEIRETIYNLYHILNHYVLFGGGYLSRAQSMMGTILNH